MTQQYNSLYETMQKEGFAMPPKVISIVGPTASGKTKLSVALAKKYHGEVVSTDSMQIYRTMDIGTAKPTKLEMDGIPHHMIDIINPSEDFSVARYVEMATPVIDGILSRGKMPILAGGTGLYLDSVLSGRNFAPYQPDSNLRGQLESEYDQHGGEILLERLRQIDSITAARLHSNDKKRIIRALEVFETTGKTLSQHDADTQQIPPRYQDARIGLCFENKLDMWERIDQRVDEMLDLGLVDEIKALLNSGLSPEATAMQAIGYKEFLTALQNNGDILSAAEEVKLRSRQYAKRQLTWFRRNTHTHWYSWGEKINFADCLQDSTAYLEETGVV